MTHRLVHVLERTEEDEASMDVIVRRFWGAREGGGRTSGPASFPRGSQGRVVDLREWTEARARSGRRLPH